MRAIKFRGKPIQMTLPNGEHLCGNFVYGNLAKYASGVYNILVPIQWGFENYKIDHETIGQFTGLYDCEGNEIFEGDILRFGNSQSGVCEVKWNESIAAFCILFYFEDEIGSRPLGGGVEFAIIGNIHDNPELLKGGER